MSPIRDAAAQFIGEVCWRKDPTADRLRVALTQTGSQILVNGVQFLNGADGYSLPFMGTIFVLGQQAVLGGTLVGDLVPAHFGGSSALALTAVLSTATGEGPATTVGIDGKFAPSGTTLVLVNCNLSPNTHDASDAPVGKGEGL